MRRAMRGGALTEKSPRRRKSRGRRAAEGRRRTQNGVGVRTRSRFREARVAAHRRIAIRARLARRRLSQISKPRDSAAIPSISRPREMGDPLFRYLRIRAPYVSVYTHVHVCARRCTGTDSSPPCKSPLLSYLVRAGKGNDSLSFSGAHLAVKPERTSARSPFRSDRMWAGCFQRASRYDFASKSAFLSRSDGDKASERASARVCARARRPLMETRFASTGVQFLSFFPSPLSFPPFAHCRSTEDRERPRSAHCCLRQRSGRPFPRAFPRAISRPGRERDLPPRNARALCPFGDRGRTNGTDGAMDRRRRTGAAISTPRNRPRARGHEEGAGEGARRGRSVSSRCVAVLRGDGTSTA